MKEQKIIVTPAFHSDFYKCQGAEEKIQPLLDNGWEIEKLTCTGKSQGDTTVVAYLSREKQPVNNSIDPSIDNFLEHNPRTTDFMKPEQEYPQLPDFIEAQRDERVDD